MSEQLKEDLLLIKRAFQPQVWGKLTTEEICAVELAHRRVVEFCEGASTPPAEPDKEDKTK